MKINSGETPTLRKSIFIPGFKLGKTGMLIGHLMVASLFCVAAWAGTAVLPGLAPRSPFLLSLAATVASAWVGGWRIGVFATGLSIIGVNYLFLLPSEQTELQFAELVHVAVFAAIALFISWIESTRRQSELEQRTARYQLEVILKGVADGITVQNKQGQPIFANDAAAILTGYPNARAMIDTPITEARRRMEAFDDAGDPLSFDQLPNRLALTQGISGQKSFRLRFIDNNEDRWVIINSSPVFDEQGKPSMAINIFRDVTESKMHEVALRREREFLDGVLSSLPVGVGVLDPNGVLLTVNQAALDLAGVKNEPIIGLRVEEMSVIKAIPGAPERLKAVVKRVSEGEFVRYDTSGADDEGKPYYRDFSVSPMRNAAGKVTNVIMTTVDITARKTAEQERSHLAEAVAGQTQRLYEILANMPGMVWEATGDPSVMQQFTFVSDYALRLTGYSVEEWLSRPNMWIDLVHPDDRELAMADSNRVFRDGAGIVRTRWITKDGHEIYIDSFESVIYDKGDHPIGVRGVTMDVTARRRNDEALLNYSRDLKRSNEDLQQFAYVASHDLQEPLRMVTSYLQLVVNRYNDRLDDDAREFIAYAVDGAARMKSLISDLLSYARVESRGAQFSHFNVQTAVENARQFLQLTIDEHNVQFDMSSLPDVWGDLSQITQLFQNLIGNAIKFRRTDDQPRIEIGARRLLDEWEFWVKDNGIGIESQYLDRIFIIFQRLHARGRYEGTGIGLAICKRVVERHGGTIRAESTLGVGTTIYFTISAQSKQREKGVIPTGLPVSEFRPTKRNIPVVASPPESSSPD